jgi:hypothetical protein
VKARDLEVPPQYEAMEQVPDGRPQIVVPGADPATGESNGGQTTPLYLKFEDALDMDKAEISKLTLEFGLSHSDLLSQPGHVLVANLVDNTLELEIANV